MDISEIAARTERDKQETIADRLDFSLIRSANLDHDGRILEPSISNFIDWAHALLKRIPGNWKDYVPNTPSDLVSLIEGTEKLLDSIAAQSSSPLGTRGARMSNLVPKVQSQMSRTVNSLKDLLLLQMIGDDRSSETTRIVADTKNAKAQIDELLEESRTRTETLEAMVDASKESTAKIAASGRARVFDREARSYQCAARMWLTLTAIAGGSLIFLAFGFALNWFLALPENATGPTVASYVFSKLLILLTVGSVATFSAKQYAANRHNAVHNFHRSSSLRTYRALLAASRDEALHDAILHQAAQTIFSQSDTGYAKGSGSTESSPIVQLINGMNREQQP